MTQSAGQRKQILTTISSRGHIFLCDKTPYFSRFRCADFRTHLVNAMILRTNHLTAIENNYKQRDELNARFNGDKWCKADACD